MKRRSISRRASLDERSVVLSYLESIGSPVALGVWLRYQYEAPLLLQLEINPLDYNDRVSFHRDYLAVKFLSKYDGLDVTVDKKRAAFDAFYGFEDQCVTTNERLEKRVFPHGNAGFAICKAREKIRRLLGPLDSGSLEKIFSECRFGPGVTSSCKGKWLSPYEKLACDGQVTNALHRILSRSLRPGDYPSWSAIHNRTPVFGNTVATVPKNSKTDRTIAVEPHINAYFQRGVGVFLRSRLRRWGVNLQDQSRNQELARVGSMDSSLATVDLKGASDTISIECVRLLLPDQWWIFLEHLRSPVYTVGTVSKRYAKHSSMGNGYTFELESLIFSAVVVSVCEVLGLNEQWSVYGDDIIISRRGVPLLKEVISYLGFSLNTEKSFDSSYFRESCGADWYDGVQVTPFYLRRKGDVVQFVTFANWLRTEAPDWLNIDSTWRILYRSVPRQWAIKGPMGLGSVHFWVNSSECDPFWFHPPKPFRYGMSGWHLKSLYFLPHVRVPIDSETALGASLYTGYHSDIACYGHLVLKASLYCRISTAREAGRWKLRSFIFNDKWPKVRPLKQGLTRLGQPKSCG